MSVNPVQSSSLNASPSSDSTEPSNALPVNSQTLLFSTPPAVAPLAPARVSLASSLPNDPWAALSSGSSSPNPWATLSLGNSNPSNPWATLSLGNSNPSNSWANLASGSSHISNPRMQEPLPVVSQNLADYNMGIKDFVVPDKSTATAILKFIDTVPLGINLSTKNSQNKTENLWPDVFPYDDNMIPQEILEGYYNASPITIDGKRYIAAQGVKQSSLNQFWKMVHGYQSEIIVTVTDAYEKNMQKCYPYWAEIPEDIIADNGKQKVVKRVFNGDAGKRPVTQFHLEGWPDQGIPDLDLLGRLIQEVNQADRTNNAPVIVHCSAGIGRTGVFIAADVLLHRLNQKETDLNIPEVVVKNQKETDLNIPKVVVNLRKLRGGMVQKPDQLRALYLLVQKHLPVLSAQ